MELRVGAKVYKSDEWMKYEVVWFDKGKVYVWQYDYTGPELSATDLPDDVNDLYFFISQQNIPVMVYRLDPFDKHESFCSHSNAIKLRNIFNCTGGWMAMNDFHLFVEQRRASRAKKEAKEAKMFSHEKVEEEVPA